MENKVLIECLRSQAKALTGGKALHAKVQELEEYIMVNILYLIGIKITPDIYGVL